MTRLNVSDGDDLSAPIRNHSGEVIVPGAATKSDAPTYTAGNGLNFSGRQLYADGWVRVRFNFGDNRHPRTGIRGAGEMGGTPDGRHGFGNWIIDQTANGTAVHTSLGSGANFGNAHGRITFEGVADVMGSNSWGTSGGHDMTITFPNDSSTVNLTNVSWPNGSGRHVNGQRAGNLGFMWSNRSGDIIARGCYWFGFPNNVWYVKPMNGRLELHNCYFEQCVAGNVRTGCDGGTLLDGCTFRFGNAFSRQAFGFVPGKWAGTGQVGIRCQSSDGSRKHVTLKDCNFVTENGNGSVIQEHNNNSPYTIHLQNTHAYTSVRPSGRLSFDGSFGRNPSDPGPPEAGGTGNPGDPTPTPTRPFGEFVNLEGSNEIVFSRSSSDWNTYRFTVDPGSIEKVDVIGGDDVIEGNTARGNVGGGNSATWAYTGNLSSLSAPSIEATINGERITGRFRDLLAWYRENFSTDPEPEPDPEPDPTPDPVPEPEPEPDSGLLLVIAMYALAKRKGKV